MLGGLALLLAAVSAGPASAAVGFDRVHNLRYELTGLTLTVRLVPNAEGALPAVRKRLWGKRVEAICSPTFDLRRAEPRVVTSSLLWPSGQNELTYTFSSDISKRPAWCLLEQEDQGEDISGVNFRAFIRVFADSRADRRIGFELRRHFQENAWFEDWLERVKAIVVHDGVIAVATDLRRGHRGRRVARLVCTMVRDSRLWSAAPDHAVYGRNDVRLRSC